MLLAAAGGRVRHRVLERRQPDPGALGAPRRRAGGARRARRRHAARCGARCSPRAWCSAAPAPCSACCWRGRSSRWSPAMPRASRSARSRSPSIERAVGRRRPGDGRGRAARVRAAAAVAARAGRPRPGERQRPDHAGHQPPPAGVRDDADRVLVRAARRRRHAARDARRAADARTPATTCGRCWRSTCRRRRPASASAKAIAFYQEATRRIGELPGVEGVAVGQLRAVARRRQLRPRLPVHRRGLHAARTAKRIRARGCASSRPRFFAVLGVPMLAGRDFTDDDRRGSEPVVIVSQSVAQRLFPNGDAVNRHLWWTDPYFGSKPLPRRIVGVVADVDDENVVPATGADGLSAGPADRRRRPPVRARGGRSVRARAGGDARHPRDLRRTSRSSAPRRSRTCARRCCRPSG